MKADIQTKKWGMPNSLKIFFPALISLIAISGVTAIFSPSFLTVRNLFNVANQATTIAIMGVGATLIIIAGGIDLSCSAAVCLCGLVSADLCANLGLNPYLALLVSLLIGLAAGLLNGVLVAYVGVVPFIATMATMNIFRGLCLIYSKSKTVHSIPEAYTVWGSTKIFGVIPSGIMFTILLYIIGHVILSKTVFGHKVSAVGGNREAAKLAGIDTKRTILFTYILAGLCYGIAGVLLTGRAGAAYPNAAEGLEMDVIAGCVIGGTAMSGGRGTQIGTWIGVMLVAVISNVITLLGISAYATKVVQGTIILVAVVAELLRNRMQNKKL